MLAQAALLLHAAVETPAAATFLFFPEKQLPTSTGRPVPRETALILQNLGGLLASSAALSLVLAVWGSPPHISPGLLGSLCLCLAIYHVFPARRAYLRLNGLATRKVKDEDKDTDRTHKTLGGPAVHLAAHMACLGLLAIAGLAGLQSTQPDSST